MQTQTAAMNQNHHPSDRDSDNPVCGQKITPVLKASTTIPNGVATKNK